MSLWRVRLSFGSPDLALSLLFATVNGWLLYYLVTILGVPPLMAGAAFVFGRVLDGLLDPLVGNWSDRRPRKPVIAIALPCAAAGFVALWTVPAMMPGPEAAALATAACFAVFVLAYTGVSVPRLAMMPAVVPGYDARTAQASVDIGFVFVGVLLASTAFPGVVAGLGGDGLAGSAPPVWIGVAAAIAILAVLAYLPFLKFIPEPGHLLASAGRPTLLVTLVALRRTPGALSTLVLFTGTVLTLVTLQSILPFWLDRGPGLSAAGQTLVLLAVFLSTIGSLPIWVLIARRLCKLRCLGLGVVMFLGGLLVAILLPAGSGQTSGLFLAAGMAGAGAGALSMCPWAMIPDVAERHARRLGAAVEGTTSAAFTMANKLAAASALFLNSAVLAQVSGRAGPLDAPAALLALPFCFALLTGAVVAILLFMRRRVTKREVTAIR